MQHDVEYVNDV